MAEEAVPKAQTRIRIQTATGAHDILTDAPPLAFMRLVKGDGFLYLQNPNRVIPYHAIVQFEEIEPMQAAALATWAPGGQA